MAIIHFLAASRLQANHALAFTSRYSIIYQAL